MRCRQTDEIRTATAGMGRFSLSTYYLECEYTANSRYSTINLTEFL